MSLSEKTLPPNVVTLAQSDYRDVYNISTVHNHVSNLPSFSEQKAYLLAQIDLAIEAGDRKALRIPANAMYNLSIDLGTIEAQKLSNFGDKILDLCSTIK